MEMMIKLEESIIALTGELKRLRDENAKLRADLADSQTLMEQNYSLEAALQKEQEVRNDANAHIEKLLNLVQEQLNGNNDI